MRATLMAAIVGMSGCWTAGAKPTPSRRPAPTRTASYRSVTIAVDAVGVAVMTAGLIGFATDADDDVSGGLTSVGMGVAGFGVPILHLAHGRSDRALGSYGIRALAVTTGFMFGFGVECSRERDLLCGLEGMLWGTAGGLAAGAVLDAVLLHGDPEERPSWSPTVTHGDGTTRVGISGAF